MLAEQVETLRALLQRPYRIGSFHLVAFSTSNQSRLYGREHEMGSRSENVPPSVLTFCHSTPALLARQLVSGRLNAGVLPN